MDEREISCRLVAVIFGPLYEDAKRQIYKAALSDLVEFRLDLFHFFDLEKIESLKKLCFKPVIFTYRKSSFPQVFLKLASLHPDYLDLDDSMALSFAEKVKQRCPQIKLIRSYHNFSKTPDLDKVLQRLEHPIYDQYKIATKAQSCLCSFRMLDFLKSRSSKVPITGLCMGKEGLLTRILSPVVGNQMCFATVEDTPFLSSMLSVDDLCSIYRFKTLNRKTQLFGLLGHPVSHSIGHLFHNRAFQKRKKDAVYIKIDVTEKQLDEAFSWIEKLAFSGLSITMPYKETLAKFCSNIPKGYPINTLIRKKGLWAGANTDAIAAAALLKKWTPLQRKKIFIIGAGGAAKAIALKLIEEGGDIVIFNRTLEKALSFAKKVKCSAQPLQKLFSDSSFVCDILIQASSYRFEKKVLQNRIKPPKIAMDLIYGPTSSDFLNYFKGRGSKTVSGKRFFFFQAFLQQEIWKSGE